jgi:predicted nucleic acid-binding protein
MDVVVDASLLVALALNEPARPQVAAQFADWTETGTAIHAPKLIIYEAASALSGAVHQTRIEVTALGAAWQEIVDLDIRYHEPDGPAATAIALNLRRRSAYDAAYIALAQRLDAELWTLDGPLYRNALSLGFPVNVIERP